MFVKKIIRTKKEMYIFRLFKDFISKKKLIIHVLIAAHILIIILNINVVYAINIIVLVVYLLIYILNKILIIFQ